MGVFTVFWASKWWPKRGVFFIEHFFFGRKVYQSIYRYTYIYIFISQMYIYIFIDINGGFSMALPVCFC